MKDEDKGDPPVKPTEGDPRERRSKWREWIDRTIGMDPHTMGEQDFRLYMKEFLDTWRRRVESGEIQPNPQPRFTSASTTMQSFSFHDNDVESSSASVMDASWFSEESSSVASFPRIVITYEPECNLRIGWIILCLAFVLACMPIALVIFRKRNGSWPWDEQIIEASVAPSMSPSMFIQSLPPS